MTQDSARRFFWTLGQPLNFSGRSAFVGDNIGPKSHYLVGNWSAKRAYDTAAENYDTWYWQEIWHSAEDKLIESVIRSHPSVLRVLDVGCGTGSLIKNILAVRDDYEFILGIDISEEMLSRARKKIDFKKANFINENILKVDLPQKYFDAVFMMRVGSHIKELELCMRKISSSLRTGGMLIFSDVHDKHNYKYTKLPAHLGKIPVKTYKHSISDIVKYAYKSSLILKDVKPFVIKDFPETVKNSSRLPTSLSIQLQNNNFIPFGSLFIFELM